MLDLNLGVNNMTTTRKKVKVMGVETYINQATGEIKEMSVINIEERDANFHKLWLGHIISALDMIGNQKIKVLNFVMDNLDKENKLVMTQRKMAEKSKISIATISETMKALQDADFLVKINSGAYQVNPNVMFKGGKSARLNVLLQYQNFTKEAAATTNTQQPQGENLAALEEEGQQTIFDAQEANLEATATSQPEPKPEPEPVKVEVKKEACKICGTVLVEQTRRDDGKKFMGCPNWKQHRVTKAK